MSEVPIPGTLPAVVLHPVRVGGLPSPSTPSITVLFEFGGLKLVPAPARDSAAGGGKTSSAATSYCPMRRLPDGVIARAVMMYTGSTRAPWACAAVQVLYPRAVTATSLFVFVFQQTCEEVPWVESTVPFVPKVPFCFKVIRTHL